MSATPSQQHFTKMAEARQPDRYPEHRNALADKEGGQGQPPIAIVVLPANRRGAAYHAINPDAHSNKRAVLDELEQKGFAVEFLDVNAWPKNPLAGRHSLLAAIDPWRASTVLLSRRRTGIVLSYFESAALLIAVLRKLLFFRGKIVVVDIGVDETWRLRRIVLGLIVPRVDAILTFGSIQIEHIKQRYRTHALVRFIPQKVDVDFYRPGIAPAEDYVLSVGDDISRDYATLLRAADGLGARLVLKSGRVDATAHPAVTVLRARLSELELRDLYARSQIVVLPLHSTLHAGGITTLLEAMAMGKAIVVSDSVGLKDYVRHEENCLVVKCGDADALKAAIQRLLNSADERTRLGAAARKFVERECTHAVHAARLAATLHDLVPPHAQSLSA